MIVKCEIRSSSGIVLYIWKNMHVSNDCQNTEHLIVAAFQLLVADTQNKVGESSSRHYYNPVSQPCAVAKSIFYLPIQMAGGTTKTTKVCILYSHYCTIANGAVFHSGYQVWLSSGPPSFFIFSHWARLWLCIFGFWGSLDVTLVTQHWSPNSEQSIIINNNNNNNNQLIWPRFQTWNMTCFYPLTEEKLNS